MAAAQGKRGTWTCRCGRAERRRREQHRWRERPSVDRGRSWQRDRHYLMAGYKPVAMSAEQMASAFCCRKRSSLFFAGYTCDGYVRLRVRLRSRCGRARHKICCCNCLNVLPKLQCWLCGKCRVGQRPRETLARAALERADSALSNAVRAGVPRGHRDARHQLRD